MFYFICVVNLKRCLVFYRESVNDCHGQNNFVVLFHSDYLKISRFIVLVSQSTLLNDDWSGREINWIFRTFIRNEPKTLDTTLPIHSPLHTINVLPMTYSPSVQHALSLSSYLSIDVCVSMSQTHFSYANWQRDLSHRFFIACIRTGKLIAR